MLKNLMEFYGEAVGGIEIYLIPQKYITTNKGARALICTARDNTSGESCIVICQKFLKMNERSKLMLLTLEANRILNKSEEYGVDNEIVARVETLKMFDTKGTFRFNMAINKVNKMIEKSIKKSTKQHVKNSLPAKASSKEVQEDELTISNVTPLPQN